MHALLYKKNKNACSQITKTQLSLVCVFLIRGIIIIVKKKKKPIIAIFFVDTTFTSI